MTCRDVQDLLSPYIDGVLEPEEMESVSRHLDECPSCTREYEQMRALVQSLQELGDVDPPEGFHETLVRRLKSRKRSAFSSWVPVGAAAAVLLIMFLALGSMNSWFLVTSPEKAGVTSEDSNRQQLNTTARSEENALNAPNTDEALQSSKGPELSPAPRSGNEPELSPTPPESGDTDGSVGEVQTPQADVSGGSPEDNASLKAFGVKSEAAALQEEPVSQVAKNCTMKIEVKDAAAASTGLLQLAEQFGGYVESSRTDGSAGSGTFDVRVPVDAFGGFVAAVAELGDVLEQRVSSRDISSDCTAFQDQLNVLEQEKERLQTLLSQAQGTEEIEQLEDKLNDVVSKTTYLQGELNSLYGSAAMPVINIEIGAKTG